MYWLNYLLILILGSGSFIILIIFLHRRKYSILTNLTLMILGTFLMLMALEFYLKVFFAEPDLDKTLAAQNWEKWYEEELWNSLGYRDIEWTNEMVKGKTKVMVAGDSFVAGEGIACVEDRFSNRLAEMLGADYVVFNVGKNGRNTGAEIDAIIEYPYPPDILVFSYFLNDIESVSPSCDLDVPNPLEQIFPSWLLPLVDNSYSANFFYVRLVRLVGAMQPDLRGECLINAYNDPNIWWLHQQQLLSVYQGTRSERIPLFIVVFPPLNSLEKAELTTDKVVNLYRERSVPVIDVANLVKDIPPRKRVASPMEIHAGVFTNKLVAEALYDEFVKMGIVKQ